MNAFILVIEAENERVIEHLCEALKWCLLSAVHARKAEFWHVFKWRAAIALEPGVDVSRVQKAARGLASIGRVRVLSSMACASSCG